MASASAQSIPKGVENEKHPVPGYLRSTTAQENRTHTSPPRATSPAKKQSPVRVKDNKHALSVTRSSPPKSTPGPYIYSKTVTSPFKRITQVVDAPNFESTSSTTKDSEKAIQPSKSSCANALLSHTSTAQTPSSTAVPRATAASRPRRNTVQAYPHRRPCLQNQNPQTSVKNPFEDPASNTLQQVFDEPRAVVAMTRFAVSTAPLERPSHETAAAAEASEVDDAAHENSDGTYYLAARKADRNSPTHLGLESGPSVAASALAKRNQELASAVARQHEQLGSFRDKFDKCHQRLNNEIQVVFDLERLLRHAEGQVHHAEDDKSKLREQLRTNQDRCQQLFNQASSVNEVNRRLDKEIAEMSDTIKHLRKKEDGYRRREEEHSAANVKTIQELRSELNDAGTLRVELESMATRLSNELCECRRQLDTAKLLVDHEKDIDNDNMRSQEYLDGLLARADIARIRNGHAHLSEEDGDALPPKPVHLLAHCASESVTLLRTNRCMVCRLESQKAYAVAFRNFKARHVALTKELGPLRAKTRISFPTSELLLVTYKIGPQIQYPVSFHPRFREDPSDKTCGVDHGSKDISAGDGTLLSTLDIEGVFVCSIYDFDFPTPASRLWKKYMFREQDIHLGGPDLSTRIEREDWWYGIMSNKARGIPWWDEPVLPIRLGHDPEIFEEQLTFAPLTIDQEYTARLAAIMYVRSIDDNDLDSRYLFRTMLDRIGKFGDARKQLACDEDVFLGTARELTEKIQALDEQREKPKASSVRKAETTTQVPESGEIYTGQYENDDIHREGPITWSGPGGSKWKVCKNHQESEGIAACPSSCFKPDPYDEADSTVEITVPSSSSEPSPQVSPVDKSAMGTGHHASPGDQRRSGRVMLKPKLSIDIPRPESFKDRNWMTTLSRPVRSIERSSRPAQNVETSSKKVAFAPYPNLAIQKQRVTVNSQCQPWHEHLPAQSVVAGESEEIRAAIKRGVCWDCAKAELFERVRRHGPRSVSGQSQSRQKVQGGYEARSRGTSRSSSLEMRDA